MEETRTKKKRAPTALLISCNVCGAPAPDHLHFGGHCCYSCRAFFRRTIERMEKTEIICRTGLKACEVSEMSKACSACRYDKCLQVGMSVSLLQGKRKKKDSQEDDPHEDDPPTKTQKIFGDIPELERIPRYKSHDEDARFSTESNPSNYVESQMKMSPLVDREPERRKYQDPFPLFNKGQMERKEDRMFMNSSSRHNFSQPKSINRGFDHDRNKTAFDSRNLSTSDEHPEYNTRNFSPIRDKFSRVIQGPIPNYNTDNYAIQRKENSQTLSTALDMNSQPSVIQAGQYRSPSNSVIRSSRTSVIQHGPCTPSHSRPRPAEDHTERWKNPQPPPMASPCNSSLLLRYEASMMKYQADLCKQRSKVLDCQARLLEQQEEARKGFMVPFLPKRDPPLIPQTEPLNHYNNNKQPEEIGSIRNYNPKEFLPQQSHPSNPANLSVKPLSDLQDSCDSIIIKTENTSDETSSQISVETEHSNTKKRKTGDISELSDGDQDQQVFLRQDIKHLFAELVQQTTSGHCLESTIFSTNFQSKVFLEADNLLTNSPFLTLLKKMSSEPKEPNDISSSTILSRTEAEAEHDELKIKVEKDIIGETNTKELKSFSAPTSVPVLGFTSEEMDWVDKIQQTMAICTKSVIREAVYQAVIDNWKGDITHSEMLGIFATGKARQAYMHILIMSNLPYFQDLSSRSQRWLMKSATAVGMELMTAVFFFAHSSDTLIEQSEVCGLATNFKKYIETKAPQALKMPARSYESLYKSPWAETIEDEIRHRRGQQLVGESLKGKDHRIMPLLYALAVYAVSETDIAQMDLPEADKVTIKKAQEHLGIIYRRFLKQLHGWKAATGYALSHIYYLSVLKENVNIGFQNHPD